MSYSFNSLPKSLQDSLLVVHTPYGTIRLEAESSSKHNKTNQTQLGEMLDSHARLASKRVFADMYIMIDLYLRDSQVVFRSDSIRCWEGTSLVCIHRNNSRRDAHSSPLQFSHKQYHAEV